MLQKESLGRKQTALQRLDVLFVPVVIGLISLYFIEDARAVKPVSSEQIEFFESEVRPLLARRCLECHGAEKQEGELRLDSFAAILQGGESGDATIVPGHPSESPLLEAVRYESYEMPPEQPLSKKEIAVFVKWIEMGAPWPGDHQTKILRKDSDRISEEDRQWWAYQPLGKPNVPKLDEDTWSKNEVDRFIWRRRHQEGLSPAPEADRATLIRRLSFDLTGLPPTPSEVRSFVADPSPQAYESLVDRLLESSRYGERQARHWLDLVRYADSDGYRIDHYRPQAWRYRDYVIRSFNEDKPYDRFVQEQIAGDELFPNDPQAIIATGYLRHWIYEYNNRDARGQWTTILNDITDTTGDVFLGMGMRCAQCHDHKFDPILQKDYYRLQSFFAGLIPRDDLLAITDAEREEYDQQLAIWEKKTSVIRTPIDAIESPYRERAERKAVIRFPEDIQACYDKPKAERTPLESQLADLVHRQVLFDYSRLDRDFSSEDKEQVFALRKELSAHDTLKPKPLPHVLAATDLGPEASPVRIPGHGGDPIEPAFPTVFAEPIPVIPPMPSSTGRRSTLARWLTQPENPMTSRVIVNRIWQNHFGQGLAANASDFGRLGNEPTHPELLDWLAVEFVENDWQFKHLHRLIVNSATYRQSTQHHEFKTGSLKDPQNHLYWRASTKRLDAEQIRDSLLSVSGQLNLKEGGPGVNTDVARRTIYTRYMRNVRDPLLDVFDLPQFFSSESSRNTTTTPVQSLLLINNPQTLQLASRLADRVTKQTTSDNPRTKETNSLSNHEKIDAAFWLAFGRSPTDEDRREALGFLDAQTQRIASATIKMNTTVDALTGKLPYRDGQAVVLDPESKQRRFEIPHKEGLNPSNFTVEAYFQVRSIYDTGAVRMIVSKWNGDHRLPGWGFGVTGKGSRRKPQTLVMQIFGKQLNGSFGEAAIFSDQHVAINKPYYAAVTVRLATEGPGAMTFYLKDLSDDDEPLLVAEMPHNITGGFKNEKAMTIGGLQSDQSGFFHGLIDDIRFSHDALHAGELLFTGEGTKENTIAYWQFEVEPGLFRDSSNGTFDIRPPVLKSGKSDPASSAFIDFCHALLNSNEFLYVD